MTARSLLRWIAGFAFVILVAVAWTTPGRAHTGHSEAPAATQVQAGSGHGAPETVRSGAQASDAAATGAEQALEASEPDCIGHQAGGQGMSCCSNTCHAVMSTDLSWPLVVSTEPSVAPSLPQPAAHAGPTVYIKRPPRSPAAQVG